MPSKIKQRLKMIPRKILLIFPVDYSSDLAAYFVYQLRDDYPKLCSKNLHSKNHDKTDFILHKTTYRVFEAAREL